MQLSVTATHRDSSLCLELNWSVEMESEEQAIPAREGLSSPGGDDNMLSEVPPETLKDFGSSNRRMETRLACTLCDLVRNFQVFHMKDVPLSLLYR